LIYAAGKLINSTMKLSVLLTLAVSLLLFSCRPTPPRENRIMLEKKPPTFKDHQLDRETLNDKVLGVLVGSAIGDAMGAPTEMWSREQMQLEYGFIDSLDDMVREPSPEGTWAFNLPAGGTTDDTRWKVLMIDYFTGLDEIPEKRPYQLSALSFAQHIVDRYQFGLRELKELDSFELEPYEDQMRKAAWLKEWAMVANSYAEADHPEQYSDALNRFYGGEMVCAGMLFSPMIGALYPSNPEWAYEQTYAIDIFDLGYAKDISGLTASLVAKAMEPGVPPDSIFKVLRDVDPRGYFESRLVGRSSYRLYRNALSIAQAAREADPAEVIAHSPIKLKMPLRTKEDSIKYARFATAYERLDQQLEVFPFHPAEIHLVNLTALLLFDFDFASTLEFVINFGRDNDTTGAVTGAILGAYHGAAGLPAEFRKQVLATNLKLGIDLEELAERMVEGML
jgi:hypothetical protein